jgi:diaminopimelate decarboxylase
MLRGESKYAPYDAQIRKIAKNGLKVKDAVEELRRLGLETATHAGLGTYSSVTARPPIRWNPCGRSVYAPFDVQIREMAKLGFSLRKAVEELRRHGLVTGTRQALHLYLQTVEPRITWRSQVLPSMYKAYDAQIRKIAKNGLKVKDAVEELRRLGLEAATF